MERRWSHTLRHAQVQAVGVVKRTENSLLPLVIFTERSSVRASFGNRRRSKNNNIITKRIKPKLHVRTCMSLPFSSYSTLFPPFFFFYVRAAYLPHKWISRRVLIISRNKQCSALCHQTGRLLTVTRDLGKDLHVLPVVKAPCICSSNFLPSWPVFKLDIFFFFCSWTVPLVPGTRL